MTVIEDTNLIE